MSNLDSILELIAGGGDSAIELKDIADQTAIARALKNRNVSPVMASGRATLPNVSGIIGNGIDRRTGAADEQRLMDDRLQIQSAEATRAANAIQPSIRALSGASAIDNVDNSPSTLTAGNDPAAVEEFNLLQGATAGAPAAEGQDTLRKYALTKAMQQQRAAGKSSGGGSSADLQLFNFIRQQHPDYSNDQILEAARAYKETFGVADVAGVENIVGNRGSGARPLTNINTVATNADAVKAAEAAGGVAGKTEEERAYAAPVERVMVDGMKAVATQSIAKLNKVKNDPALSRISGWKGLFPNFPGGSAADVQGRLGSIRSMLGFDKLQEIRAQNKTGGGVGALSDPEREALELSVVALAQSQSDEELRTNLDTLITQYNGMMQRLEAKYQAEYGNTARRRGGLERARTPDAPFPANAPKRVRVDAQGNVIQ